jgi:hypothetical protein
MIWPFSGYKNTYIDTTRVHIIGSNKLSLGNIFQYVDLQNPGLHPSMCLSPVSIGLCSITAPVIYGISAFSKELMCPVALI